LFTASTERVASADKLAEYEQLIAASEIPAQIGDIKTDDLVGPSALQVPGNHIRITEFKCGVLGIPSARPTARAYIFEQLDSFCLLASFVWGRMIVKLLAPKVDQSYC